jgi:hypothetical protein
MLKWVPAVYIEDRHLRMIAASLHAAPEHERMELRPLVNSLQTGTYKLFEWDDGCLIVAIVGKRLMIHGFCCFNLVKQLPALFEAMNRLAADWQCDTIETTCFDSRLTSAMKRLGAQVVSTTLALSVGTEDERR